MGAASPLRLHRPCEVIKSTAPFSGFVGVGLRVGAVVAGIGLDVGLSVGLDVGPEAYFDDDMMMMMW